MAMSPPDRVIDVTSEMDYSPPAALPLPAVEIGGLTPEEEEAINVQRAIDLLEEVLSTCLPAQQRVVDQLYNTAQMALSVLQEVAERQGLLLDVGDAIDMEAAGGPRRWGSESGMGGDAHGATANLAMPPSRDSQAQAIAAWWKRLHMRHTAARPAPGSTAPDHSHRAAGHPALSSGSTLPLQQLEEGVRRQEAQVEGRLEDLFAAQLSRCAPDADATTPSFRGPKPEEEARVVDKEQTPSPAKTGSPSPSPSPSPNPNPSPAKSTPSPAKSNPSPTSSTRNSNTTRAVAVNFSSGSSFPDENLRPSLAAQGGESSAVSPSKCDAEAYVAKMSRLAAFLHQQRNDWWRTVPAEAMDSTSIGEWSQAAVDRMLRAEFPDGYLPRNTIREQPLPSYL